MKPRYKYPWLAWTLRFTFQILYLSVIAYLFKLSADAVFRVELSFLDLLPAVVAISMLVPNKFDL